MKLKLHIEDGYQDTLTAWAYRFKAEGDTPELRDKMQAALRPYIRVEEEDLGDIIDSLPRRVIPTSDLLPKRGTRE